MEESASSPTSPATSAYVLPFVLYLVGTVLASQFDDFYPLAYALVVGVVSLATCWMLRGQAVFRIHSRILLPTVVGVIGIVLWIAISRLKLEEVLAAYLPEWFRPAPRVGFNPFDELSHPASIWGFIAVRMIGLAVLVPVAEELFWRGFLLRWLIDPDWQDVPLGKFTLTSFAGVTALFTVAHPEWLAAAVYCVLLNGLLYWRRDLWSCIVAHAVSNLLLGGFVLITGTWWLW